MRYIKPINEFLSEAISMKMYKENLPKKFWYDKSAGYKKWDTLFGKGVNRISIPLNGTGVIPTSTPLMDEINSTFQPLGYKINSFIDYIDNKAYKLNDTKNPLKIGKLLSKIDSTLFSRYDTDPDKSKWKQILSNKEKALKIIISRHPYDLLGMSSGRDWRLSSCMRLGTENDKVYMDILASMGVKNTLGYETGGAHSDYIKEDVEQGVLVAYVVNMMDNNINNPLSRILIKPYVNKDSISDILWVSSNKIYGKQVDGFKKSVDEWLSSWQGDIVGGVYCIKRNLYDDDKREVIIEKPISQWTDKDRGSFLNKVVRDRLVEDENGRRLVKGKWSINQNGEVDVDGNVNMSYMNLTEIPVKFGSVSGFFYCYNNNLTSLVNSPNEVGGFNCGNNSLTSLIGCPLYIKEYFNCEGNNLTSLIGAPKKVGGFNCDDNELSDLIGAPETEGVFFCRNNNLTSLIGAPKKVTRFFCGGNFLTSLLHSPTEVSNDFNCHTQKNGHKFTEEDVRAVCQVEKIKV